MYEAHAGPKSSTNKLSLSCLQDLEKFKQHLKSLDDDQEGSDLDDEDDLLDEMIQTAQFHPPQAPHPRSFQVGLFPSRYL